MINDHDEENFKFDIEQHLFNFCFFYIAKSKEEKHFQQDLFFISKVLVHLVYSTKNIDYYLNLNNYIDNIKQTSLTMDKASPEFKLFNRQLIDLLNICFMKTCNTDMSDANFEFLTEFIFSICITDSNWFFERVDKMESFLDSTERKKVKSNKLDFEELKVEPIFINFEKACICFIYLLIKFIPDVTTGKRKWTFLNQFMRSKLKEDAELAMEMVLSYALYFLRKLGGVDMEKSNFIILSVFEFLSEAFELKKLNALPLNKKRNTFSNIFIQGMDLIINDQTLRSRYLKVFA